ncbi:MAG TPA: Na+/H+ antiporter NhaA, partial [Flavobacteriaceae bacterium]|nr:Na+/H+ antiporter NhaA [Flavobacteriaceae bacterium]
VFYTKTFVFFYLAIALAIMGVLFILNRLKIYNLIPYIIGGVFMWYFMLQSGVHATIAGVLLAFVIPFGDGSKKSPSYILQDFLDKPVAFLILPLFALANTSIAIGGDWLQDMNNINSAGIILGLTIGKPLGIWLFSFIGTGLGLCMLPSDLKWKNIFGAGLLGGIGFTMSIFITLLAYDDPETINNSKMAILVASLVAGLLGYFWLRFSLKKNHP